MIGIYRIKNIITGKCYIGKSESDIEKRWYTHILLLKNNKHLNKNGKPDKLQNSWNKYGEENFIFGTIEEYLPEECNEKEIYWIAYYNSLHNGYNQTEGGEGCNGYKHNSEARQKISDNTKKAMDNPEIRKKNSEAHKNQEPWNKGKTNIYSEETLKKISKTKIENGSSKGEKNGRWIPITDEMINDYQNGIRRKDFLIKYKVSYIIWDKLRKQIQAD